MSFVVVSPEAVAGVADVDETQFIDWCGARGCGCFDD
jgi:hypothetical protein